MKILGLQLCVFIASVGSLSGRHHYGHSPAHLVPLTRVYPKKAHSAAPRSSLRQHSLSKSRAKESSFFESENTRVTSHALSTLSSQHKRGHAYEIGPHGTIPLTNLRDSQYVGPVGVGTRHDSQPQEYVKVVFDTGSTNLWVSSELCTDYVCKDRHKYDHRQSVTYADPPSDAFPLDITFGTGELSGPQAVDSLSVGPYVVRNQTFAMIEHEFGSIFSQIPFEGILGLAFPSMAADGHIPFFDNVMQQNVLGGRNEFSFFFTKLPDQASAIFFGGVDDRFYEHPIKMFPVVQPHYWSIELLDFLIGNTSYATTAADPTPSFSSFFSRPHDGKPARARIDKLIIDTGTTYFTAPSSVNRSILQLMPGGPCASTKDYPDITYVLRDEEGEPFNLVIPAHVYMVTDDGEYCEPAFMAIDVPSEFGPAFLLGEVFMRHWHTTFDRGDGSPGAAFVGFAKAKHDPQAMMELEQTRAKYM